MELKTLTTNRPFHWEKHPCFQVALTALDENTRRRELAPLEAVDDSFPKTLLTLDPLPYSTHKGIAILNAVDWLTGKE